MFVAKDVDLNTSVYIDEALSNLKANYVCPVCGGKVVVKNGSHVSPHFAHRTKRECDTFTQDMSEWHKWWQERFPKRNREHVEELTINVRDYCDAAYDHGFWRSQVAETVSRYQDDEFITLKHRADVRACGYVIEFQNSPISYEEFNERNWFYNSIGCKVVWIFNFIDEYVSGKMSCYGETNGIYGNGGKYRWKRPSKTFMSFLPQEHKKRKEDDEWIESDVLMFFQIAEHDDEEIGYIEQVVWSGEDDDGCADFRRFITRYNVMNASEFYNAIINRKL